MNRPHICPWAGSGAERCVSDPQRLLEHTSARGVLMESPNNVLLETSPLKLWENVHFSA